MSGSLVHRLALLLVAIVAAAALAAGCGESDAEQAQDEICSARDGIASSVQDLRSTTLATASSEQVQGDIDSIRSDLETISDNADAVDEATRSEIRSELDTFQGQVSSIVSGLQGDLSLQSAKAEYQKAVALLQTSYQNTLAKYDCT